MELAGRGQRLLAAFIDAVVMAVPYGLSSAGINDALSFLGLVLMAAVLVVQLTMLTKRGQTVGKRVVGVRIVLKDTHENGGFVANVAKRGLLNGLINLIPGYFILDSLFIFREDRRCVHDMIGGTIVVQGQPDDAPVN
jgi:uncharacterized RDD family membrane protein YckC